MIAEIPVVEDENELYLSPENKQSELGLLNERVKSDIHTTREETVDDGTTEDRGVTTNAEETSAKGSRRGTNRR